MMIRPLKYPKASIFSGSFPATHLNKSTRAECCPPPADRYRPGAVPQDPQIPVLFMAI